MEQTSNTTKITVFKDHDNSIIIEEKDGTFTRAYIHTSNTQISIVSLPILASLFKCVFGVTKYLKQNYHQFDGYLQEQIEK
jgi:hypothetical protein